MSVIPSIIGIYKITSPTDKIYIGQSKDVYKRWRYYSFYNCRNQTKLYNSLRKYGVENHKFEIIEECREEQLNKREKFWIKKFNCISEGLNLKEGGNSGRYSEETKLKMSISSLGKPKSKKHKKNISKARLGIKFTQEHINNMSKSRFKYNIICLENGVIYKSANQASKELNIYPSSIIKVCKGIFKQTKGYTFKFIE